MSILDKPDFEIGDIIVFLEIDHDIEFDEGLDFDDCDCYSEEDDENITVEYDEFNTEEDDESDEDDWDYDSDDYCDCEDDWSLTIDKGYWVAEIKSIDGDMAQIEILGYVKDKNEVRLERVIREDFWHEPYEVDLHDVRPFTPRVVNDPAMYERVLL